MHRLADLAALHDQGCLYTLTHTDEIVMDGRYCQQTRDCHMFGIHVAIGEYDIIVAFIDTLLCLMAQGIECLTQAFTSLRAVEENG